MSEWPSPTNWTEGAPGWASAASAATAWAAGSASPDPGSTAFPDYEAPEEGAGEARMQRAAALVWLYGVVLTVRQQRSPSKMSNISQDQLHT